MSFNCHVDALLIIYLNFNCFTQNNSDSYFTGLVQYRRERSCGLYIRMANGGSENMSRCRQRNENSLYCLTKQLGLNN